MKLSISLNGRTLNFDPNVPSNVREISPGLYSVLRDGVSYQVYITRQDGDWRAVIDGRTYDIQIDDPRDASRRSSSRLAHMHQDVKAPMPGKVVRVLVAEGAPVEAGQGLVVVEAMKMQNELKALRAGKVMRVAVSTGDTVSAGDVLVTLD